MANVYHPAFQREVALPDAPIGLALNFIADAVLELRSLTDTRIANLEARMANLGPALDRLEAAVRNIDPNDDDGLRTLLEAERARTAELVAAAAAAEQTRLDLASAEAAEDVSQDAALAEAVRAYQAAVADTDQAVVRIDAVSDALEAMDAEEPTPEPAPEPGPVEPAPGPGPTPEPGPAPEPTPEPAPAPEDGTPPDDGVQRF